MVRREPHVVPLEAAGRNATDDLCAFEGHAAKELGFELHRRHRDVADVGTLDRNHRIETVHFDVAIVNVVDRRRVLFGPREHAAHVALFPMRHDAAVRLAHHHQMQNVPRPVHRVFGVRTEDDIAIVLLRFFGDFGDLWSGHLDRQCVMLVTGPVRETGDRKFVE